MREQASFCTLCGCSAKHIAECLSTHKAMQRTLCEEGKANGKSDADIIAGASRPLGDQAKLGEALYKEFGEEVRSVLEKYKMFPGQK